MTDLKRRLQAGVDRCFAGFTAMVIVAAAIAGMVNACSDEPEPIAQASGGREAEIDTIEYRSGHERVLRWRPDTVYVEADVIVRIDSTGQRHRILDMPLDTLFLSTAVIHVDASGRRHLLIDVPFDTILTAPPATR